MVLIALFHPNFDYDIVGRACRMENATASETGKHIIQTNYYYNDHLGIIVVDSISRNERSSETEVEARKKYAI